MSEVARRAHLKYAGTDTTVQVTVATIDDMMGEYDQLYRRRFSFLMPERDVVVEAVSVELTAASTSRRCCPGSSCPTGSRTRSSAFSSGWPTC